MTNEQNFKKGDKVYMAYNHTINAIVADVCDEGKYDYYVKEDGAEFTQGCYECDLLDAKSAFLRRLGALLREFDARIDCQHHEYAQSDYPCVIFKDEEPLFWLGNDGITADNIMDFESE